MLTRGWKCWVRAPPPTPHPHPHSCRHLEAKRFFPKRHLTQKRAIIQEMEDIRESAAMLMGEGLFISGFYALLRPAGVSLLPAPLVQTAAENRITSWPPIGPQI